MRIDPARSQASCSVILPAGGRGVWGEQPGGTHGAFGMRQPRVRWKGVPGVYATTRTPTAPRDQQNWCAGWEPVRSRTFPGAIPPSSPSPPPPPARILPIWSPGVQPPRCAPGEGGGVRPQRQPQECRRPPVPGGGVARGGGDGESHRRLAGPLLGALSRDDGTGDGSRGQQVKTMTYYIKNAPGNWGGEN